MSHLDSEASKKDDGAPIRPPSEGGAASAFLTESALLRLEERLRDQRGPAARSESQRKADGATQLRRNNAGRRFSEPDALLCALLLIIGAAALGDWQEARIAGSPGAALVNSEAGGRTASVATDNDQPLQPITNAVKSSAAMRWALSPSPPNEQPVEAQGPATPGAFETIGAAQTPVAAEAKGARTKFRVQGIRKVEGRLPPIWPISWGRHARLVENRRVAETEELQQIHASIRRPTQYGRCWVNDHQTYYHWAECLR